ncbi:transposase [Actinomyces oricola]|uniref:transposase n=1 Tax=Actinomyces oricola TaxID=206043 RepID=UPI000FFE4C95|nr:transposase [Actinomyces oricola]
MLEVIEKGRSVTEVASSYDLVPQTVRNWIGKYKREHATEEDSKAALESAEIARLKNELRELRQGCEFLKKQPPGLRKNSGESAVRAYQSRRRQISDCFDESGGQAYRESGYYSWRDRRDSQSASRKKELGVLIKAEFDEPRRPVRLSENRRYFESERHDRLPQARPGRSCTTWAPLHYTH